MRDIFGKVVLPFLKLNWVDTERPLKLSDDWRFEKAGFIRSEFLRNLAVPLLAVCGLTILVVAVQVGW